MLEKWQMNMLLEVERECGFTYDLEEIKGTINDLCSPLINTDRYTKKIYIEDDRDEPYIYVKKIRLDNKIYHIIVNDTEIKVDCIGNFPNGYIPNVKVELNKKDRILTKHISHISGHSEEILVEYFNYKEILNDLMNTLITEIATIETEK